jgi:hypothetical protein
MSMAHKLSMRKILMGLLGLYLLVVAIYWVWLMPSFVDRRISSKIKLEMSGAEVAKVLGAYEPMDMSENTYCEPKSMDKFNRISLYHAGSVPLLPLPMGYVTTTTFCFDTQDRLVTFQTKRWFDGP